MVAEELLTRTAMYKQRMAAIKAALKAAMDAYEEYVEPLHGDVTVEDEAAAMHEAYFAFIQKRTLQYSDETAIEVDRAGEVARLWALLGEARRVVWGAWQHTQAQYCSGDASLYTLVQRIDAEQRLRQGGRG